jgi:hypothetical protein
MNPLLFADWGRMNRLFTKVMWTVAAIMACVVLAVTVSAGRATRTGSPVRAPSVGAHAIGSGAAGVARSDGSTR